jgi:hypothetical protein
MKTIGVKPEAEPAKDPAPLLALLAQLGGAALVPMLAEMGGFQLPADDRRFLAGPIVVHANGWQNDIPKWMFDQARAERVEIILGHRKNSGWLVGPTEIAAVMYPAVMANPLHHSTHELYLWASSSASARHFDKPIAEIWAMLNMRPIEDAEVIDRHGRLWDDYRRLCDEIRRKVIAAEKSREPPERKQRAGWRFDGEQWTKPVPTARRSKRKPAVPVAARDKGQLSFF